MNKSDKFSKIRKSLNLSKANEIFIPMYSEELFVALGKGNRDDFYDLTCVEDIAYEYFESLKDTTLEKITFGVIDEEYLEYIRENNLEDNKLTQKNYVTNLSKKKRNESWIKNGYNHGYDFGILPLIFENNNFDQDQKKSKAAKYNFVLTDEARNKIKKSILKSFLEYKEEGVCYNITDNDIFISPYLVRLIDYEDESVVNDLFDVGVAELDDEDVYNIKEYNTQEIDADMPIEFFGVLVLFKYEVPPTITKEYIEITKNSAMNVPDINVEEIENILETQIDITHELLTVNLIYPNAIDSVIEEFMNVLAKQVISKINTYDDKMNTMAGHFKSDKKGKKKK